MANRYKMQAYACKKQLAALSGTQRDVLVGKRAEMLTRYNKINHKLKSLLHVLSCLVLVA